MEPCNSLVEEYFQASGSRKKTIGLSQRMRIIRPIRNKPKRAIEERGPLTTGVPPMGFLIDPMTIVQQMLCRKEFVLWAASRRLPIKKYPSYGERLWRVFKAAWLKS